MNRILVWAGAFALVGCSRMAIDGQVVDAAGQPVPGARVAAIGTTCATVTDDSGRYTMPCPPGDYDVVVSIEGYTSETITVSAPERERYDQGKTMLVRIPSEKGLFLFSGEEYLPMKAGELKRLLRKESGLTYRSVCLDTEHSTPNELDAGVHKLFDYEHIGWRPFRLDEDGCAYRDHKNRQQRWTVDYREKAVYETYQVNEGKTIATLTLEPGDYFIADWKGFFVPIDDKKEDRHSFSGYWLHVK